jgi:hypothetical protein
MEAQNKPSLVVDDLAGHVSAELVYESLCRRGVFKWLAVRRRLIRLKNVWKERIREIYERELPGTQRGTVERARLMGELKALEACRAQVRKLCHSPRYQVQDNDRRAREYFERRK